MTTENTPTVAPTSAAPNGWTHVETSTPTEDRFVVATSKLARRGHDLLDDLETIKAAFAELTTENASLRAQRDDSLRMLHELQRAHDLEMARTRRLYTQVIDQKQRQLDTTTYLAEELQKALHATRALRTAPAGPITTRATCPGCNGSGFQVVADSHGFCMVCHGEGTWTPPTEKESCTACQGTGREDHGLDGGGYVRCTTCGGRGRW